MLNLILSSPQTKLVATFLMPLLHAVQALCLWIIIHRLFPEYDYRTS